MYVKMNLQESGEMYLETILILSHNSSFVRSIDVCEYMNYSKPSVSRAMKILKDGGYITIEKNGKINLTDSGRAVAEKIYERHSVLTSLLKDIGVSDEIAALDACKIEHVISNETFEKIKEKYKK